MEWDLSTITAGDYTVEYPITPDGYRRWYNNEYRKPAGDYENGIAPASSLKRFIIDKVENVLTKELLESKMDNALSRAVFSPRVKRT